MAVNIPGILFCGLLVAVMALSGCATSKDNESGLEIVDAPGGVEYTTILQGVPDEEFGELLEQSLRLFTLAHRKPASKPRLRRRAESDMETVVAVLRSEGYYNGSASFMIAEQPFVPAAPDPRSDSDLDTGPEPLPPSSVAADAPGSTDEGPFAVTINIETGQRFTLAQMSIEPAVESPGLDVTTLRGLGLRVGSIARAIDIVDAEARAVDWLTDRGYPYARFEGRTVTADIDKHTLNVNSRVIVGPRVRFGALRFEGLKTVQADYLQSYTPWKKHALYSRSAVERFQTSLFATNLFESVSVQPASLTQTIEASEKKGETGTAEITGDKEINDAREVLVPITVAATEGKRRSVGAGARYSTDEGIEGTAFYENRNLFGANETSRATVIGGSERQEFSLSVRKPQFLHKPNVLFGSFILRHEDDDIFEERTLRLLAGLEHKWNKRLTLSGGLSFEVSEIDENLDGDFDTARLFGAPLTARYDASDNLLDPATGYRLSAFVTPYTGTYRDRTLLFGSTDFQGAVYVPMDEAKRYVFAARGRLGSVLGAERDALPATKRLYSGGGGSVRGYKSRFIGPLDDRGEPIGGRSVLEAGIEMRIRVGKNLGIVPFIDAGTVSEKMLPDFSEDVQVAAGLGVRYYTLIGPIRADVAIPVNRRDEDDDFQFYISIGQAF